MFIETRKQELLTFKDLEEIMYITDYLIYYISDGKIHHELKDVKF